MWESGVRVECCELIYECDYIKTVYYGTRQNA